MRVSCRELPRRSSSQWETGEMALSAIHVAQIQSALTEAEELEDRMAVVRKCPDDA